MTRNTALILVLILLAAFGFGAYAQDQTTLVLPEASISLNAESTVDVRLECPASNCIGIDVTVAYDAEVIAIERITAGEFLGTSARVIVSEVQDSGTFRFSALATSGTTLPTEGVIFSIEMTGLTLGETELNVSSLSIFRRGGTVQASTEAGLITVTAEAGELPTMRLTRRLTVRSGAGPNFDPVGTAEPNVDIQVLGVSEDGAWYLIALSDTVQGWIAASRFITFEGDINMIPIVTEQTEITTEEPTPTSEPPTPTNTASPEPTVEKTEPVEPAQTEDTTPEVEATSTEIPTEVPPTLVPTNTPTTVPANTVQPTATLRGDSEAGIAPPASDTPEHTNTPTLSATDTPLPTATPTSTEPPTPTFTPTVPEPCTVTTSATNIPVHVGPNRAIRATFPANQVIAVTGQQQADDGTLWWRIAPLGNSQEVDRFWVRQSDVTAQGGCDAVGGAESPQVIGGGGGGGQFSGSFRGGQNASSHTLRIGSAGNYAVTCNGTPVYPEFAVNGTRSQGQTTLVLNLSTGSHTLTVFATTQNAGGQTIGISSYNCSLSRR